MRLTDALHSRTQRVIQIFQSHGCSQFCPERDAIFRATPGVQKRAAANGRATGRRIHALRERPREHCVVVAKSETNPRSPLASNSSWRKSVGACQRTAWMPIGAATARLAGSRQGQSATAFIFGAKARRGSTNSWPRSLSRIPAGSLRWRCAPSCTRELDRRPCP